MSKAQPSSLSSSHSVPITFTIDRKGDRDNLVYGSLSRSSIPRHKLAGHGRILGLGRHYRLISDTESSRIVRNQSLDLGSRPGTKSLLTKPDEGASKHVHKPFVHDADFEVQKDYVSLGNRVKRRRLSYESKSGDDRSDSSADTDSGPLLPGKSRAQADVESAFDRFKNDPNRKQLIDLTRKTDEVPGDATVWRDLIEHHATLGSTPAMKMSIYERALPRLNRSKLKDDLIVAMMREAVNVYDSKKRASTWQAFLGQTSSWQVWFEYLDSRQAEIQNSSFDDCLAVYVQVWKRLSTIESVEQRDEAQVLFIQRLTSYLRDCGYIERAVAMWQAVVEYTYGRPGSVSPESKPFDLRSFEQFWESEAARAGEPAARNAEMPPTSMKISSTTSIQSILDWSVTECSMDNSTCLPARASDDLDDDDPYRVVLFSDISDFIFRPHTNHGRHLLLNAFLHFCSVPEVMPLCTNNPSHNAPDPFLCYEHEPAATLLDVSKSSSIECCQDYVNGIDTLFYDEKLWFTPWRKSSLWQPSLSNSAFRAIEQIVETRLEDDILAEYSIAMHLHLQPAEARKYAKKLLKTRSASLRLYNAYGLVECRLGNFEAAEKVWSTALKMSWSFEDQDRHDTAFLWHTWILACLGRGLFSRAKGLLQAVVGTGSELEDLHHIQIDSAADDTTELSLHTLTIEHLRAHRYQHAVLSADLQATSIYLHNSRILAEALLVYQETATALKTRESPEVWMELLYQRRARLIWVHTSSSKIYRPRDMIDLLEHSCRSFPNNSIFYGLRQHYASESGIIERLRQQHIHRDSTTPPSATHKPSSVIDLQRRITSELSAFEHSGSTVNSIRAAFMDATALGEAGHHCPAIWLQYIQWELSAHRSGSEPPKNKMQSARKVVGVFYDAIRACPWVKRLYMLAFAEKELREALGNEALERIFESMIERGFRIRVDISNRLHELLSR